MAAGCSACGLAVAAGNRYIAADDDIFDHRAPPPPCPGHGVRSRLIVIVPLDFSLRGSSEKSFPRCSKSGLLPRLNVFAEGMNHVCPDQ
jgi:hypothetical protein